MELASASNSAWRDVSSSVAVVGAAVGLLLALLRLDLLADGEHAHVAEQHVADVVLLTRAIADAAGSR